MHFSIGLFDYLSDVIVTALFLEIALTKKSKNFSLFAKSKNDSNIQIDDKSTKNRNSINQRTVSF